MEARLTYAFEHATLAADFLAHFEATAPPVYHNYRRLAMEQGVLEQFTASPLVIILMEQPPCCLEIAVAYLDKKMKKSTQ